MPAVKDVGEPCEEKPHARFDGGREETNASRRNVARPKAPPAYPTATERGVDQSSGIAVFRPVGEA